MSKKIWFMLLSVIAVLFFAAGVAKAQPYSYVSVVDSFNQPSSDYSLSNVNYTITIYGIQKGTNITLPANAYGISVFYTNGSAAIFTVSQLSAYVFIDLQNALSGQTFIIRYSYVENYHNVNIFTGEFDFIPSQIVRELNISMILPRGASIAYNNASAYSPQSPVLSTNGQNIILAWRLTNQSYFPGSFVTLPFVVLYGMTFPSPTQAFPSWAYYIIALGAIVTALIAYFLLKRKKGVVVHGRRKRNNPFKTLLSDDENKVLSVLKKDAYIIQNQIVAGTGFSKSKVSKIIRKLLRYKLIKVVPIGRINKIKRT